MKTISCFVFGICTRACICPVFVFPSKYDVMDEVFEDDLLDYLVHSYQ